jgi:class 3 adenylate cyclase
MPTAGENLTQTLSGPAATDGAGQRCRLSVLFSDLSGSTELSSDLEAEDYAELLGALRQVYTGCVAAHGGVLVRIQGDGMLAIFGWPQPREGDCRRAVAAALQMHRQVAALRGFGPPGRPTELRLHSGVHAGLVLVQRGDAMTGALDLLGRAPNIAARLSDAADRDEVLVNEESLGPDLHHFDTGAPRVVEIDHRGSQVLARPVLGRGTAISSFEARTRRRLQPFIGRQTELRLLDEVLGQALAGATLRLAIAAPPGVGKTRLAREFLAGAERKGCRVLEGHGTEEAGNAPLQPLAQMLRGLLTTPTDTPPEAARVALDRALQVLGLPDLAAVLAPLLGLAGDRGGTTEATTPAPSVGATLGALGTLFEALAGRQPLVLFLDDWQWADATTQQWLSTLGRDTPGLPLLVLATTRGIDEGDAQLHGVQVLDLVPFSQAETTDSVQHLLPQADPFIATEICLYSGGNPLYVEELCHSAVHDGPEGWLARRLDGGNWLNVLVESRVARLPAEQAALLRLAAVIGTVLPAGLLQQLSGRADDDPAWAALADQDLLYPDADGGFRFKHGLTRDVIYEAVGLQERRELHASVARTLAALAPQASADAPHEALAYHHRAAGQPAQAAHHAEAAGDRAAALSVLDRARSMYHLALSELDRAAPEHPDATHTARWLSICTRLALVSVFDGARADLPVLQRAVAGARASNEPLAVANAEHSLGYVLYALGESAACITHIERARQVAGHGDDPLAVQIRASLGQAKAAAADYGGAQPLLEEAVAIKRSHRRSKRNAVGLAYSLVCLASVVGDRGEFDRAHALMDEAWSVVDGPGHQIGASIQGWRSAVLTWQGRWEEARQVAQESAWIAERTRSLFQFCQGRVTAAYADWRLTGDERFIAVADQATGWLEPRDSGLFRSLNHGWLVDGWLACGQREKARRHAARAAARGRRGDLIGAAMASRALALDAAHDADEVRAARWLARAQRVALQRQSAHELACNTLCAADLALMQGRPAEAQAQATSALQDFQALQMHWHAQQALQRKAAAEAGLRRTGSAAA